MKYEFQVRIHQRYLKAIVGAFRFRQRLLSGDVYGTIGRAAMDAWMALPDVAHGAYPARRGEKGVAQSEVLKSSRVIENIAWRQKRPVLAFSASPIPKMRRRRIVSCERRSVAQCADTRKGKESDDDTAKGEIA